MFINNNCNNINFKMDFSMPRPRINGAMFPDFQSKSVTVLGIAAEVLTVISFD